MNTTEMTAERDRCKSAMVAAAQKLRNAAPEYEREPLVGLTAAYAECVDALTAAIATGGTNTERDALLDAAKALLGKYEQSRSSLTGGYIIPGILDQVRAYAAASRLV